MMTQPDMILMKDGQEISRHRSDVEAFESALGHGAGVYTLIRPDATIEIPEELEWQQKDSPEDTDPEPEPEPDPSDKPDDLVKTVDESALLNFKWWNWASRYSRYSKCIVLTDDTARARFKCQDMSVTGGGGRKQLEGSEYSLIVDGAVHTTIKPEEGELEPAFEADITDLPDGWHVFDISAHGQETSVPLPVFVLRGDTLPRQDWVPVWTGSHEIKDKFYLRWVPARHDPLPWPLPERGFQEFDPVTDKADLVTEPLTASVVGHPRLLTRTKEGVLNTATKQRYFWSDVIAEKPVVELLDGPRGANTHCMVTHIEPGKARQQDSSDSPLMGNYYFTTPWGFHRADKYGKVTTLAGAYHENPPPYWDDNAEPKQWGDWSDVEGQRQGFWLIWGMCWLKYTLAVDQDADRIMDQGIMRTPHETGPIALLADSKRDAVRGVEFSATAHDVEPRIFEFYQGEEGSDVWDNVQWNDKILVSERGKHRLIQLDSEGNLERVVLEGDDLARIDRYHVAQPRDGVTMEEMLDSPVVAPEGLFVRDDWLYFASAVTEQVRRVHLVDGRLETVVSKFGSRNKFGKIAVDEDGTVYVTSWDINPPEAYKPDGTEFKLPWGGGSNSYNMAVGVGNNQILYSSVMQGIKRIRRRTQEDMEVDSSLFSEGQKQWNDLGLYLDYGPSAESLFGKDRPWGVYGDAVDHYMKAMGHLNG